MPHQTFDRSIPLTEQRLRVALAKGVRKQDKKHATGHRRARTSCKARNVAVYTLAMQKKRCEAAKLSARRFWAGEWL